MSAHELRLQKLRKDQGIPEEVPLTSMENSASSGLRTAPEDKVGVGSKPVDWVAPVFPSLQDLDEGLPRLLGGLAVEDGSVNYGSKKSLMAFRSLFQNVGDLYKEHMETH